MTNSATSPMVKERFYVGFDTETSGLCPIKNQVLTAFFMIMDDKLNELETLNIIVPIDPEKEISEEAMRINKIDLEKHNAEAKPVENTLYVFLTNFLQSRGKTLLTAELIPICHNFPFDSSFIKPWSGFQLLSYHALDTVSIAVWLQAVGLLRPGKVSLQSLTEYFEIPHDAHTAEGDVRAMVEVLKKFNAKVELLQDQAWRYEEACK